MVIFKFSSIINVTYINIDDRYEITMHDLKKCFWHYSTMFESGFLCGCEKYFNEIVLVLFQNVFMRKENIFFQSLVFDKHVIIDTSLEESRMVKHVK